MAEKKEWVFIVNPVAGNGFAAGCAEKVKEMAEKYKVNAEVVFTERRGHATQLAAAFIEKGFRYIIAVGGDGTVNETARALLDKENVILGAVSAGTGNDFTQILGFSERFTAEDWDVFFKKKTTPIDVGICNGNIFLNGMGLGFDAQVAAENYKDNKEAKEGSKYRYLWHIIKTLFFYKEKKMATFVGDRKRETDCFINTVANGRRFAGGFFLTPKAVANDGLLDVCMIKKLTLLQRFKILLKVPKGTHIEDNKVNYYQTRQIRLEFDAEVPHHLDGELYFSTKFNVGVLPGNLKIIYNDRGNHFFNVSESV
jgi:YegS/Rv2252/BmrU family lipid kinase